MLHQPFLSLQSRQFLIQHNRCDCGAIAYCLSFDFAAISLTPTTGTLQLRGIFPNPDGKILPGLFARVRLP